MIGTSVDEVHESSAAIELGEKHGCVCLRFRRFDPTQTRSYTTIITTPFSKNSASITAHPHLLFLIDYNFSQSKQLIEHTQTKEKSKFEMFFSSVL